MGLARETIRPATAAQLAEAVADALSRSRRLAIRGGGSKDGIGVPAEDAITLDMTGFSGIVDYDPAELVLTAGAGTPLAEIEALITDAGQALAFEPFDHGPVFGSPAGTATIGGVVAAGVAGARRVSHGGARDHLLGFEAVSGRGEPFVAGARVVKNVTGYDLPKLAAGSWGRLFAMTQVTLKVLPAPRETLTLIVEGLDFETAWRAMSAALSSQAEVGAAAYLPFGGGGSATTLLRLQGFGPSVAARGAMLDGILGQYGSVRAASREEAQDAWQSLRTLSPLDPQRPLWRINVAPRHGPAVVAGLGGDWLADWGGGLIWLASDDDPERIRAAARQAGGHAMLVRASEAIRRSVPTFHPAEPAVAALEARIRRAFDPAGVFETGRFGSKLP